MAGIDEPSADSEGRLWDGPGFSLQVEPLDTSTRAQLVSAAERVSAAVNHAVGDLLDRTGPSSTVRHLDWAYLRLGTVISTLRFGSAGASTAMIARSLIEDAVMWDWAIATSAADELPIVSRLRSLARLPSAAVVDTVHAQMLDWAASRAFLN